MAELKFTVLCDNIAGDGLLCQWGLSVYIEYRDKKILLDTGASPMFAENADRLGINLKDVDFGVLSHAHYDHANGLDRFFEINSDAVFYISANAKENCYGRRPVFPKYIGIKRGTLAKWRDRISPAGDYCLLCEGVYLMSHSTLGLEGIGKAEKLYRKNGILVKPDDFCHEQTLVFDTEKGMVIFNSCSHAGADNIICEVQRAFPDKKIYGFIGGFHLYRRSDSEVKAFAERVKNTGIHKIVTGHCTGERGYGVLKECLAEKAEQFYSGYVMEI